MMCISQIMLKFSFLVKHILFCEKKKNNGNPIKEKKVARTKLAVDNYLCIIRIFKISPSGKLFEWRPRVSSSGPPLSFRPFVLLCLPPKIKLCIQLFELQ